MSAPQHERAAARRIRTVHAAMLCVALLLVAQGVLLSAAIEGYLGGNPQPLLPAALASGACFATARWLFRAACR